MSATRLHVHIKEGDQSKVQLNFPIYTLKVMDGLIPSKVMSALERQKISLKDIIDRVVASQYAPQTLFEHRQENKTYRVWIE